MLQIDEFKVRNRVKYYNNFPLFQRDIFNKPPADFHIEQVKQVISHRYSAIVNPVGHGKSTLYSQGYVLWRLWREKDKEIILMSNSLKQAKRHFAIVKNEIETNPFLQHLMPTNPEVWNQEELKTTNGNHFSIRPFSDNVRGFQPHYLILDDILAIADYPMEKIKDIFFGPVFTRVQSNKGQLILVGTPICEGDLFDDIEELAKTNKDWFFSRYPAVITDETGKWIKPLWEKRYTLEALKKLKEVMGSYRFDREYMCLPRSEGEGVINKQNIDNSIATNLSYTWKYQGVVDIGVDFATSGAAHGDYTVICAVDYIKGVVKKENVYGSVDVQDPIVIRRIIRKKGMPPSEQINLIEMVARHYNPRSIIVDESNVGGVMKPELLNKGLPVIGQKFNPAARFSLLLNLAKLIEQDRLIFPFHTEDDKIITKLLVEELNGLVHGKTTSGIDTLKTTTKHDDILMALAMAVSRSKYGGIGSSGVLTLVSDITSDLNVDNKKEGKQEYVYGVSLMDDL